MSSNLEGRIDIELKFEAQQLRRVDIRSSRPQLARKLMTGASPTQAAERAGMIFSLCGKAQRVACEAACEAALGVVPVVEVHLARARRVLMELAQEHAWQFLLNWPRQTGAEPDMASLLLLRQAAVEPEVFAASLSSLLQEVFLGQSVAAFQCLDLSAFDAWCEQSATLPARLFSGVERQSESGRVPLLPPLQMLSESECLDLARQALLDEAFCSRPLWAGVPAETGAISRMQSQPLLNAWIEARGRGAGARLLARLLELAGLPHQMHAGSTVVQAYRLADKVGMAVVETSRGLLLHVVRLADGVVADYRIVAPTEWNFHPLGALAEALSTLVGQEADATAVARARLLCQSLDPCVAFGVEVSHA